MNQQQDWRFSLLSKARNLYMRLYILNFLLPRPRLTMYSFRNTCSFNLGLQSGRQQAQCSRNFKATLLELVSIKKEAIRSTLSKKSGLESTEQRGNFRKQFHRWGRAFERIFIFSIQQQATCSQRDRYQKRQTGRRFSRTCRRIILTVSRVSGVTAGFSSSLRSSNPGAALRNGRQNSDDVSTWVKVALMVKNSQNSSQRPCRLLNLILSLMKLPRQVSFLEVGQLLFSKLRQAICWKYFSEFSTSLRLSQHFFRPKQISSTLMKFPLRRMGSDNRARAVLKLVMAQRYCALSSWIWPLLQWQLTTFWESTSGKQKSRWILKYSSLYSSASSSISLLRNTFEKSSSTAILKIVDSVLSTRGRLSMTNWQASCLRSKSYRQLSRFIKDWKQKETCSALPGFYSYSSLTMTMYFRLDSSQNARMAGSTLEVAIYWAPMAMKASMKWISISPLQNCQLLTSRQSHKMSWHFSLKQLTRTLNSFSTWTTSSCSYSWSCQMCWVPVSMRPRALLSWGSYAGCTSSSVRRVRHPRTTVFFSSGLSWASWQPNRNRQARSFRNFLLLPSRQFLSRLLQADSSFLLSFLFLTWHSCSICPSSSLQLMKGSGLSQAILCSCPMNSSEQNPQVLTATRTEVTRAVSSGGSSRKTTMRTTTSTSCSSFSQEQTLEAVCLMRCLVRSLSLAMSWQASPGKSSLNRQQMVFIVQQLTCTSVAAHSSPENPAEDQYEEALGVLSSVSWLSSSSSPLLLCEQLSSRPCRYDSRFSQLAVQQLELEEEEEEEEEEEMQGVVLSRVTLRACRSLQNRSTKPDLEGLSGSYRAIISLLGQPRLPRKYVSVFSPGLSLMECETPKSLSTYRLMEGEKRVLEGLMSLCTNLTACSSPTHSLSCRAQVFLTFCSTISHSSIWNSMPSLQHTRSYTLLIITCGPMPSIEQILYMQYSFMALRIQSGQNRSLESSKPGMLTTCFRSLVNISRLMATFLPSTSASLTTPNVPCPKLDPWLSSFPPRFFLSSARFRMFSTWTTRQNRPMSTSNMHSRPFSLLLEGSTQIDPSLTIRPQKQSSYPIIFTLWCSRTCWGISSTRKDSMAGMASWKNYWYSSFWFMAIRRVSPSSSSMASQDWSEGVIDLLPEYLESENAMLPDYNNNVRRNKTVTSLLLLDPFGLGGELGHTQPLLGYLVEQGELLLLLLLLGPLAPQLRVDHLGQLGPFLLLGLHVLPVDAVADGPLAPHLLLLQPLGRRLLLLLLGLLLLLLLEQGPLRPVDAAQHVGVDGDGLGGQLVQQLVDHAFPLLLLGLERVVLEAVVEGHSATRDRDAAEPRVRPQAQQVLEGHEPAVVRI